ncbi:MAG TPA: LEA type 2 family protein [Longimicrobiaceae bacterium]|jgi:LEA14-like dessication related protein|nr:LEA type 2 family protein [Longimicrobiaceae bacterium]
MTNVKRALSSVAVLAAVALSACTGSLKQPTIDLQGLSLAGFGLQGGTVMVNLRVHNPNSLGFRTENLTYDLYLKNPNATGDSAWTRFAQGTSDEKWTIEGFQTRDIQIPVSFSYGLLGGAGSALLRNGSFEYRALGHVDVHTGLGSRQVPFRKTGVVYMSGATR